MTRDRSDAVVITHRTADGRGVRHEYEPQSDGGYAYTEYVLTEGGDWRPVGGDDVETLDVEGEV